MAKYKCSVCGYIYDEEKEGQPLAGGKDSILSDLPCGFIAHNLRLRHIACAVALPNQHYFP